MAEYIADSNLILRHLLQDDVRQSPDATRWLSRALDESSVWLTEVVVAEILWVMTQGYDVPYGEAAHQLEVLLRHPSLRSENKDRLVEAFQLMQKKNVPFTDAYLSVVSLTTGATVATFDRKDFKKLPCAWEVPTQHHGAKLG
jgi:predicted nucleic acid-binding protein